MTVKLAVCLVASCLLVFGASAAGVAGGDGAGQGGDDQRVADAYANLIEYKPDAALSCLSGPLIESLGRNTAASRTRAARYMLLAAYAYKLRDDDLSAAECVRIAHRLDSSNNRVYSLLLEYLHHSGQHEEARMLYSQVEKLADDPLSLRAKALVAIARGNDHGAIALLSEAVKKEPDDVPDAIRLAVLYRNADDKDNAVKFFGQAAAYSPPYQKEILLARAEEVQGRPAAVIQHLRDAGKLNPPDPLWHTMLAVQLADGGRVEEAEEHFAQAASSPSRFSAAATVKYALYRAVLRADFTGARRLINEVLVCKPYSAMTYHGLGILLKLQGQEDMAAAAFEKAIELEPVSNSSAFRELCKLDVVRNNPERLAELAKRWCECCPTVAGAWTTLARSQFNAGKLDEACANFQRAQECLDKLPPHVPRSGQVLVCSGLANCFYAQKKELEAIEQAKLFNQFKQASPLQAGLPIRPEKVDFDKLEKGSNAARAAQRAVLADVLYEYGNLEAACVEYRKAAALDPKNIAWHSCLLKALIDKRDVVEAAKEDAIVAQHVITNMPKAFGFEEH